MVGVCSYLLVHFWYTRIAAVKSAMNAMFTNRVGDFFLTIGFFTLFFTFGTLDYSTIFILAPNINVNIITFIAILLLIGAGAKSAQLGLMKALIQDWCKFYWIWIWTLIYAGTISKALDSEGPLIDSEWRQGIYQQETNEKNYNFLNWFIGFAEGDGSFYITNNKSIFSIHLHLSELPLLYLIQTELNMGTVHISKKSYSALFMIKSKKEIEELIKIFNGNIFIKKKQIQFKKWVSNFNKKYNRNIEIKDFCFCPSLNDGWLSGIIDAEGCFYVSVTKRKITQRFVLGQTDAKEEFVFLTELIGGYHEEGKKENISRVIVNYSKAELLISYLNIYKLRSNKGKSFDNWMAIYFYRKSNVNELDYKFLKKKANLINQLRKVIHL